MQRTFQPIPASRNDSAGALLPAITGSHPARCGSLLAGAFLFAPVCADSPMIVDTPLMILFTTLVLAGGISFGLLYRHMHDREEDLGNRAQGSEENLRALLTMTDDAVLIMDSVGAIRTV